MKVLLIGILALSSFTIFAGDVIIRGNEAKKLMDAIIYEESSALLENSLGATIWKNQNIVCTLFDSHANSENLRGKDVFCIISLGK